MKSSEVLKILGISRRKRRMDIIKETIETIELDSDIKNG